MTQKKSKAPHKQPPTRVLLTNETLPLNEEKSNRDLWLIAFGAILGFVFSLVGSWAIQAMTERQEKQDIAQMLIGLVQQELDVSNGLIDNLKRNYDNNKKVEPGVYEWLHDATLINSLAKDVGKLDIEVIRAYAEYAQMVIQCKSMRELYQQRLEQYGYEVRSIGNVFDGYILTLKTLDEHGKVLLEALNRYYP